jgi:dephospho-CoA kinase
MSRHSALQARREVGFLSKRRSAAALNCGSQFDEILGLTGDIACGKSSVARMLQEKGAEALDSDQLVRELYADAEFAERVQALFASEICDSSGGVDRAKLGALVFCDAAKLRALECWFIPPLPSYARKKCVTLKRRGKRL